jgi:beta-glucosidase
MGGRFPAGFVWGAATASYQIEGAVADDGRTPSCWDVFTREAGAIRNGDTGDIACDAYHRLGEDLDLMAELGLQSYRFSIAWSRVIPSGTGSINPAGIRYYERLVDGLIERGIQPTVTLFHWDLPQVLQDRGGWASRECAGWFADYAAVIAEALGDRVARWITLNEPAVVANHGYRDGTHEPGLKDSVLASAATHHLLLGHGLATKRLRSLLGPSASIGITLDPLYAVAARPEDAELAAEIAAGKTDLYLQPLLAATYPRLQREELVPKPNIVHHGDLDTIAEPIDFLGVNFYDPVFIARRRGDLGRGETPLPGYPDAVIVHPDGYLVTGMDWIIDPDSFHDFLMELHQRAPSLPLYITENGRACYDYVDPNGEVHDPERIAYLSGHLEALRRALGEGVDVRGYFVWSLLDNFEWTEGYSQRFGLVFVDFGTQRRILKDSARFYARVIASNTVPPLEEGEAVGAGRIPSDLFTRVEMPDVRTIVEHGLLWEGVARREAGMARRSAC